MDPAYAAEVLAGRGRPGHLGLVNVDRRLRSVFGPGYGLIVETAPDAGTRVRAAAAALPARGGGRAWMRVLAVDDVGPALDELRRLLSAAPGVEEVETAPDALAAVRLLQASRFDAVFLDIAMPGDGRHGAGRRCSRRMTEPPAIVFVTAFDEHAAAAYEIGAVDYLLKPFSRRTAGRGTRPGPPLHRARFRARAVRRSTRSPRCPSSSAGAPASCAATTSASPRRRATTSACTPPRAPTCCASRSRGWRGTGPTPGSCRVHRGFLLAVARVRELRSDISGGLLAHTDVGDVPVSRRHARELRERLLDAATKGLFE